MQNTTVRPLDVRLAGYEFNAFDVYQLDFKAFWQLEMQSLFGAVVWIGLLYLVV